MPSLNLIFTPVDLSKVEFNDSRRAVELFVEARPEWFPAANSPLANKPIHLLEWLIDYKKKMGIKKHRRVYLHSQFAIEAKRDGRVMEDDTVFGYNTIHVELRSVNKPADYDSSRETGAVMQTHAEEGVVTVTTKGRQTIITNKTIEVKSPDGVVSLESWRLSLLPNGQQTWVRTFHRRPETKQDGYCPVMQDEARQHAHALLRRWAGIDTIDEAYRRFFWLVVTNPAARGAPALKEQAQLIEAIEEYARMVPNPTPEEVKTYVLSVLRHEIETGVSLMCAKLRNSNVTIEDLQMGRVILDPDGTTRQPLDDSGDATATLI